MELTNMLFPVVVHKERRSAFGVTVPDLPGCITAGDTLDQALRNVQGAVETYLHGETEVPVPSPLDQWSADPGYSGGTFALVDVNLDFMADETVRVNITAKRSALALIDRVAKARGEDRSQFLIRAALERATRSVAQPATDYPSGRPLSQGTRLKGHAKPRRR